MVDKLSPESIKGDRSMSQGFVAQYAAEAALHIDGVESLAPSFGVVLKEIAGVVHEGKGVRVVFDENDSSIVAITVYPVVYYGKIIPEIAWSIQEKVKNDVERFTGLTVDAVNVHVCGVVARAADEESDIDALDDDEDLNEDYREDPEDL